MSLKRIPGFGKSGTSRMKRADFLEGHLLRRSPVGRIPRRILANPRTSLPMSFSARCVRGAVSALNTGGRALRRLGADPPSLELDDLLRAAERRARLERARRVADRGAARTAARLVSRRGESHDARPDHRARADREPARESVAPRERPRREPGDRARGCSRPRVHHRSAANGHDPSARPHEPGSREPRAIHVGGDVSGRARRDCGRDRSGARAHAVAPRLGEPSRARVHAYSSDRARSPAGMHRDPRASLHGHPVPHDSQRAVVSGLVRALAAGSRLRLPSPACCSTCK